MKKNLKIICNILQVFILFYVFFVSFLVININNYGYSEIGKYTFIPVSREINEYLDDYNYGDLLIINNQKLNINDEVYYYVTKDSNYYISKAKILKNKNDIYITDNNINISNNVIVGNKVFKIKYMGFVLNILLKEIGYFVFIIIPISILLVFHIYDFSKSMRKLNDIRINNLKKFYNNNDNKIKSKKNNESINKTTEDIELLEEVDNKKDEIEILDF